MPFLINRKRITVYQALFLRAGYQARGSLTLAPIMCMELTYKTRCICEALSFRLASYPGSWGAERKEPGIYCSCMHVIIPC